MRIVLPMFVVMFLTAAAGLPITANEPAKASKETKESAQVPAAARSEGYLGFTVARLHESLIAHLEELLGRGGSGVLVEQVAKDSPAERAGLRRHDILVKYNDHRVNNPEECARLIHEGKPGEEVTLSIVRAGKQEAVKAKLGEREVVVAPQHRSPVPQNERAERAPSHGASESMWTSFDEMVVTRLGNQRFKAQIKYEDTSGKIETRSFEGTREEIRKDIEAQKGLPVHEREHLLRALNFSSNPSEVTLHF